MQATKRSETLETVHQFTLHHIPEERNAFRRVRKIEISDYSLCHVCLSVSLSVRPHGITELSRDPFSCNLVFLENLSRKVKFHENMTRITGTLHEDQYTFIITSRSVFLRMKKFPEKL
jgi:hypothetical protein